jgi:hypothetical protein
MPTLMYRDPNTGQFKPLMGGTIVEDNFQASDAQPTDPDIDLWLDTDDDTTGQIVESMNNIYFSDMLATFDGSASHTGYLLITFPNVDSAMMNLKLTGYVYSATSGAFEIMIGGYQYEGGPYWYHTSVDGAGRFPTGLQLLDVRFMHSGVANNAQFAIAIGSSTLPWSYPKLSLSGMAGHVGSPIVGTVGWSMNITTDISAWTVYSTKQVYSGRMWQGTQAQYDAITTKDSHILYVVNG